jgi:hypothetical protein
MPSHTRVPRLSAEDLIRALRAASARPIHVDALAGDLTCPCQVENRINNVFYRCALPFFLQKECNGRKRPTAQIPQTAV